MSTQGRRAVFWLLQEAPSCSFPLLLGTCEEEQTQGCSSCSSALRPHLETPGEKTEMLKYHMGSTSPKLPAAGKQRVYLKQMFYLKCILNKFMCMFQQALPSAQITWQELKPFLQARDVF